LHHAEQLLDIDRARTFLEIVQCGSFLRAAERLHVTQTTVSARIRTLEEELGRQLFVRNRNGAHLTPAGREFERFAQSFVQIWERARHQLAMPPGRTSVVTLACEPNLCDPLLLDWIVWMKRQKPHVAVRADIGDGAQLLDRLRVGSLDIAVLCTPALSSDCRVELLGEESLILVRGRGEDPEAADNHVHVDRGPQFSAHAISETLGEPDLVVGLGTLGLDYIRRVGGVGYFRKAEVAGYVDAGELEVVEGAREFSYPVYAAYAEAGEERADLKGALEGLKAVVAAERG
jgi:DNA-binding transcriptional LysR family regulator